MHFIGWLLIGLAIVVVLLVIGIVAGVKDEYRKALLWHADHS